MQLLTTTPPQYDGGVHDLQSVKDAAFEDIIAANQPASLEFLSDYTGHVFPLSKKREKRAHELHQF